MTETGQPTVLAVNVVHEVRPDPGGQPGVTAIDKRPVPGPVRVTRLGLVGDRQMDTASHGGVDQALYAYAAEDARWWGAELGREIRPGQFGENLTLQAVDVSAAVIGQRWRIGGDRPDAVEVVVRAPRTPCQTFARTMDEPHWVKRFAERGAVGAYLAVAREGVVSAGDPVEVLFTPEHGVGIREVFHMERADPTRLAALATEPDLHPELVSRLARLLARSGGSS